MKLRNYVCSDWRVKLISHEYCRCLLKSMSTKLYEGEISKILAYKNLKVYI